MRNATMGVETAMMRATTTMVTHPEECGFVKWGSRPSGGSMAGVKSGFEAGVVMIRLRREGEQHVAGKIQTTIKTCPRHIKGLEFSTATGQRLDSVSILDGASVHLLAITYRRGKICS